MCLCVCPSIRPSVSVRNHFLWTKYLRKLLTDSDEFLEGWGLAQEPIDQIIPCNVKAVVKLRGGLEAEPPVLVQATPARI